MGGWQGREGPVEQPGQRAPWLPGQPPHLPLVQHHHSLVKHFLDHVVNFTFTLTVVNHNSLTDGPVSVPDVCCTKNWLRLRSFFYRSNLGITLSFCISSFLLYLNHFELLFLLRSLLFESFKSAPADALKLL